MRVKIELEPGENEIEAEELLIKALTMHSDGGSHKEDFEDPAARDASNRMIQAHSKVWQETLREISEILDQEFA